jgi:hypothetical protein
MLEAHPLRRNPIHRVQGFTAALSLTIGLMLAPTASAGVVNDVLSTWNLHVSECDENPIELPATLNVAMFEAVNRIAGKYTAYLEPAPASASGSMEAAAAAAAHAVLVAFCADQSEVYDKALTTALAGINDAAARDAGVTIGKAAAAAVMAHRADAGANLDDPVFESPAAGVYVPTVERVGVNLARARPWVMTAADEVRSPAPPALTSAAWARDFNEIKRLGSKKSDARTAAQTDIGKFWGGRSVRIVLPQLIGRPGRTLVDDARFLALANMAWVDSYIAMMDGKYAFNLWRPVTAIRFAATDGNDQTEADAQWTPLLETTPPHPEYPCGHCLSAGAVGAVIEAEFGASAPPIVLAEKDTLLRRYDTPREYIDEVAESRLLGGVHYRFSINAGRDAGIAIGKLAAQRYFKPVAAR